MLQCISLPIAFLFMQHIVIILVGPQLGENIGAAARIMSNFGMDELRIVAPRDPWPNEKAVAMAAGGSHVLDKARIYSDIYGAVEDLNFVCATTANFRDLDKIVLLPRNAMEECYLRSVNSQRIGIMFGRENSGLTNKEVNLANKLIVIPTNSKNRSLNLAQAIAIVAYELMMIRMQYRKGMNIDWSMKQPKAVRNEIEVLYSRVMMMLENGEFFPFPEKKQQMSDKVRNMLLKMELTSNEVKVLHGILSVLAHDRTKEAAKKDGEVKKDSGGRDR